MLKGPRHLGRRWHVLDRALAPALLAGASAVILGPPVFDALARVLQGLIHTHTLAAQALPIDIPTALRTLLYALAIGAASSLLALPAAWVVRTRGMAWMPLLLVPMLSPPYLAYAGWDYFRAPGVPTGDWLASAGTETQMAFARGLAALGLALWAWPIAALVIWLADQRVSDDSLDALRLESRRRWAFLLELASLRARAALLAAFVVALVMLGSTTPLHLAQINTLAIQLWADMTLSGADARWLIWIRAWPLIAIAVLTSIAVARIATRPSDETSLRTGRRQTRRSVSVLVTAAVVWGASVVLPAVLLGMDINSWQGVATFWDVHQSAVANSALVGAFAGAVAALMTIWGAIAFATPGAARHVAAIVLALFTVAALLPGVMVGSATLSAWNGIDRSGLVVDSPVIVALGHLARFGIAPMLLGAWLARLEPTEARDMRRLHGVQGLATHARASLLSPLAPAALGAALILFALSIHEIEASVFLAPPGRDTIARRMLEFLHLSRLEPLGIGAVTMLGLSSLAALGASIAITLAMRAAIPRRGEPAGRHPGTPPRHEAS